MSQEKSAQEPNNTTTDSVGDAINYLKNIIKNGSKVLVAFLIVFIFSIFLTQCSKKDYTSSLNAIESVSEYQLVNESVLESSGQIINNISKLNGNNQALKHYLDKDVKSQFNDVSGSIGALNSQIGNLYSLLNNTLMVMSIILGIFTLIIAVLGFYISNIITARYREIKASEKQISKIKNIVIASEKAANGASNSVKRVDKVVESYLAEAEKIVGIINDSSKVVKESLDNTLMVQNEVEKYNNEIQNALSNKGHELYETFRKEHIASIITDLKENVENIEFYHSELITNLRYLSFNDLNQCLNTYYISPKISADQEISSRYVHILMLLDLEMCLRDESLLIRILNHRSYILKLPFTYVQLKNLFGLFVSMTFKDEQKSDIKHLLAGFIKKDNYSKFRSFFRNIETKSESDQFIKGLLKFDINIFDGYIARWKQFCGDGGNFYENEINNMALMEQFKLELTPENEKIY
ncbi:MAG: hypothetical protein K2Y14_04155 [Burkholderiales bacterium]|nr:hypothetical protein [Burkholderiales bacterium]